MAIAILNDSRSRMRRDDGHPQDGHITSFVGKLLEQDDVDALREGVRVLAQAVMETEVSTQIGAAPYERSSERSAYRNGYRTRRWDTRVGTIELKIPKVTAGAYSPRCWSPAGEPRRP
jgi:transposase-like protein